MPTINEYHIIVNKIEICAGVVPRYCVLLEERQQRRDALATSFDIISEWKRYNCIENVLVFFRKHYLSRSCYATWTVGAIRSENRSRSRT